MCDSRQPETGADSFMQRLLAEATPQHKPEGISVLVAWDAAMTERLGFAPNNTLLRGVALSIAATEHPGIELTGKALYIGLDELGAGQHEVVLEIGTRNKEAR